MIYRTGRVGLPIKPLHATETQHRQIPLDLVQFFLGESVVLRFLRLRVHSSDHNVFAICSSQGSCAVSVTAVCTFFR